MKNASLFLLFLLMATVQFSCKKDSSFSPSQDFDLYLNYWNPTGTTPSISFDAEKTSPEIVIDFSKEFDSEIIPPSLVNVNIDNMRIVDDNGRNYSINDITAYEFVNGDWEEDVEFTMDYEPLDDVAVFLVLDASKSLGSDFENVIRFSNNFVNAIFEESPQARIGIISFSDQVTYYEPSSDRVKVLQNIQSITTGTSTALYQAVDLAIDKLEALEAASKAMVIFTDGKDNLAPPQLTASYLSNRLQNGYTGVRIMSYVIGFKGDNRQLDEADLESLSANGGVASFANSSKEVESSFNDFSKSIATVYSLIYTRNQQIISEDNKRVLKFVLHTERK
ncbi:MAG: VWA domain-containing protein [Chitinophagales bacterium]